MIMEQALESVFILPHAVSIQGDGNMHPIRISTVLKLYHLNLYICLCDTGFILYLGTESQSKLLYLNESE